jgi:hypothetical protein
MTNIDEFFALLISQLKDPFRVGLLIALIATTMRNAAVTGWALPLAAGMLFVAYIIAFTFPASPYPAWQVTAVGFLANLVLTGALLVLWRAVQKFRT